MNEQDRVNILLVDDQPAKLMAYEVILSGLGENLLKSASGKEALESLLRNEIAVILVDVCMPDLDGFELAAMVRDHPRFRKIPMIFVSAIQVNDIDRLRGYEMGAVDYLPVPVIPEVLRAKVKVFAELYRKTRQLERLNAELEDRVSERTAELERSNAKLRESEKRRGLALAAGNMGSWDWDWQSGDWAWDEGHYRIFGVDPDEFEVTPENVRALLHPDDIEELSKAMKQFAQGAQSYEAQFRIRRPDGEIRWCVGAAAASMDANKRIVRISGVTSDVTERKEAEQRQMLLAREVDHRAKNALALVQSIVRLTKADTMENFVRAIEGRIAALSRVHTILSMSRWQGAELRNLVEEELAPYLLGDASRISIEGPRTTLKPTSAQTLALVLHELATNAAKYGALSTSAGRVALRWTIAKENLHFEWEESGGPPVSTPSRRGFGTRSVIASVESQLGGKADFDWRPAGMLCRLTAPRAGRQQIRSDVRNGQKLDEPRLGEPLPIEGLRIAVVEDEALVAMVMCDMLSELGYSVVGPFSNTSDALAVVRSGRIDAAILDVNLGNELAYEVADELKRNAIPFAFVTGYGTDDLESRFRGIPVFQKPVEKQTLQAIFQKSSRKSGTRLADRPK
jgi:PAS domain S-box-containing protein